MSTKQVILHRGEKFAVSIKESGRFSKDVAHVGKWFHPVTKREVNITPERLQKWRDETNRYVEAGNKLPMRDGHKNSVLATMGEWTGKLGIVGDSLVATVEPKLPAALEGIKSGAIDGVSVVVECDVTDSKGNHYDEVITAIDATDFPVVTEQKEFVALSRDSEGNEVFFHESLKLSGDSGDVHEMHDELHSNLKKHVADFSKAKEKNGADHADTKAAAGKMTDAAIRLRKQAQVIHDHVQNMSGGPVYYDRTEPTPADKLAEYYASLESKK